MLPAGGFCFSGLAGELGELEQVFFRAAGEGLGFGAVVVAQQIADFLRCHQRGELRGQARHVAVAALQPEGGRLAVAVVLRGGLDVGLIDLE